MDKTTLLLLIFFVAYVSFIVFPKKKTISAVLFAGCSVCIAQASIHDIFLFIDWNVLALFVGMLFIVEALILSNAPSWLAEWLLNTVTDGRLALLCLCALTGLFSSFLENVGIVLIMAPLVLEIAGRLKVNPTYLMIAIAISSNLQGTATLIGDPPSMILAQHAHMTFNDFFVFHGKPGLFFAIEIGALCSLGVLYFFFSQAKGKAVLALEHISVNWIPSYILGALIATLILFSSLGQPFSDLLGLTCMLFGLVAVFWIKGEHHISVIRQCKQLDWHTTFFLISIFTLVGTVQHTGGLVNLANLLSSFSGSNMLTTYIVVIVFSIIASAFIDNVPFFTAMLPVVQQVAEQQGATPFLLYFGLAIGCCVGGNISPIGATANITAVSFLKTKKNIRVSFGTFIKIGLPFTIVAVAASASFLWLFWK